MHRTERSVSLWLTTAVTLAVLRRRIIDPIAGTERQDRIRPSEPVDPAPVLRLRKLSAEVFFTQAANLVLVQVANVIAHDIRGRPGGWLDAVRPQPGEHVCPIPKPALV